ncbi:hypothetical protein EDD22DRAFT_954553 [Suillus occidentalis]|nr:hypothetical protein EDD22DRAFT_954553 [Suillus occidentalis]
MTSSPNFDGFPTLYTRFVRASCVLTLLTPSPRSSPQQCSCMPDPLPRLDSSRGDKYLEVEFVFWSAQDPGYGATVRKPQTVALTKMLGTSYGSRKWSRNTHAIFASNLNRK